MPLEAEEVTNAALFKFCLLFRDTFQDKRVNAIAGPWVVVLESFINHERQPAFVCHLDCEVQRVIVADALKYLHPVKNVLAFGVYG